MTVKRYLFAGLVVGFVSLAYNFIVYYVFRFYPDLVFAIDFLKNSNLDFYIVIFVKNFLVGIVLTIFFALGYKNIEHDLVKGKEQAKGIFFFILYAIFALISFSLGDMLLMRTYEGMLLLLTVDGVIEILIATIPIRLFVLDI